jgi:hypothetical protein
MTRLFARRLLVTTAIVIGILGWARNGSAEKAYGLAAPNTLILFDTSTPGTIVRTVPITFLPPNEQIVAIDIMQGFGSGEFEDPLIGLGTSNRIYLLNPRTGSAQGATPFATALNGTAFGFDFNPMDDTFRVVSDTGQNFRLTRTGSLAGIDTALSTSGSVALAYTNGFLGRYGATTTLYGIDAASDTLVRQGSIDGVPTSPNNGVLTTIGPLGVDTTATVGFDIGWQNQAFATLTVGGESGLYSINLATGGATLVGNFGGGLIVTGLALQSPIATTLYGVTDGTTLVSFNSADPSTILNTVTITGLQPGETIVGMDVHGTDQLYAVGSTSRLYTIDQVTGAATEIGPGPFSPALDGTAFGVAFSQGIPPQTIRILSDAEQNLRVNPLTGAASSKPSLSPVGNVVAATYVRTFVGEAPSQTLYGIDSASDQLVIVGQPDNTFDESNNGVVTPVGSLGVDASSPAGLDVDFGTAWAAFQVDGLSRLYTIDLATGAASLVGTIGTGTPLRGLTVAPPGRIGVGAAHYFVDEGSGTATVTLVRTGSPSGKLSVRVRTTNLGGQASHGVDFTATEQTVVFPDGVTAATFSIPILEDAEDERSEAFRVAVEGRFAQRGLTSDQPATFVWIQDNDGPDSRPSIAIASPTTHATLTARGSFITLAGTAADDVGIVSVTWSNNRTGITQGLQGLFGEGTAIGTTNWTAANIPLYPGTNILTVRAFDARGGIGAASLTVTVNELQYSLAEGATGTFFETDILLANPNNFSVPIEATFLKEDGTTVTQALTLPATTRMTIPVATLPGLDSASMSTFVTSTNAVPIVVERTMRWDRTGYGAHTETASTEPALTWYFAEGSQGFFHTFLMLANPGSTENSASVEFLFEDGTSLTKTYPLLPTSRFTLAAGDVPELANRSFGMTVTFTQPGMAERAMYFGTPVFNGGHDSAGATSPSTEWILSEGATGTFFTTFLLLANPGTTAGDVTITYLPEGGTPVTKTYGLAAKQRRTINVAFEDPSLAHASVAARVNATVPVIAERAQYWPGTPDQWYEAHSSFGLTGTANKWGLAEGRVGGPNGYQTFIMLANPTASDTTATIQFLREPGRSPRTLTKTFEVRAQSRVTVALPSPDVPELADETFGALITAGPIVVERAMYSNANGQFWAAGTNAPATRLP